VSMDVASTGVCEKEGKGKKEKEILLIGLICDVFFFLIRFFQGDRTIFKCRFCCAIATYFCGGMCHYCDPCHARAGELTDL
jgi:hypothetical protein